MRKHFIWLVLLGGCGTAGSVGTAGVSGGGNPDVQGEWVSGTLGVGATTVLRFDSLGRLDGFALRTESPGLPGFVQPSISWVITDYPANTQKVTSLDGFITGPHGQRAVTTWSGSTVVVELFVVSRGELIGRWELSLSESFNLGVILSGTFSGGAFTTNWTFRNAAEQGINPGVPW